MEVLAPKLVQEATGDVVDIGVHADERFGDPASTSARPGNTHEAWSRGWARCDYLPLSVAVRFDGC
eukprot:6788676-Karenia_brevis.AAC.1